MNFTIWADIENKLKCGFTYEQIKQYTGVDIDTIKRIEKEIKKREGKGNNVAVMTQ